MTQPQELEVFMLGLQGLELFLLQVGSIGEAHRKPPGIDPGVVKCKRYISHFSLSAAYE